jgi:hypothetical protein
MSLTVIPFHYYETAKKEYDNENDNENDNGNGNDNENDNGGYKFELICEYAKWLYIMNECIRIWE